MKVHFLTDGRTVKIENESDYTLEMYIKVKRSIKLIDIIEPKTFIVFDDRGIDIFDFHFKFNGKDFINN